MAAYKTEKVETTIGDAISDAASELSSLHEEMSEWQSNMEEKLSQTDKYSQVSECVDALAEADGLDDKGSAIVEALELLAEGREEVKPCAKHAHGVACTNCGFSGDAGKSGTEYTARNYAGHYNEAEGLKIVGKVAPKGEAVYFCFGEPLNPTAFKALWNVDKYRRFSTAKEATAEFEKFRATVRPALPKERAAVTPIEPMPAAKGILEEKLIVAQSVPTRKGRASSRSVRCGNATSMVQAALDALDDKVEALKAAMTAATITEWDEAVETIETSMQEIRDAIDTIENVEFPGMY